MKKTIALLVLMLFPSAAMAEEPIPELPSLEQPVLEQPILEQSVLEQPHWSLEVKGGAFTPALDNWSQYYDRKSMPEYAASLAYMFVRQFEAGVGLGWLKATGHLYAPLHGSFTGNVAYELYPLNVFVVARAVMSDEQWLIPYIGGGWTRMYYQEHVEGQTTVNGHADGFHVRGGLQLSLDILDPDAANLMFDSYGIHHTFVFVEAEYTRAVVSSISTDLGGKAFTGGLLFEF